jgi:hypothetical protein
MSLTVIMLLLGGMVLLTGVLCLMPVLGKYLEKLVEALGAFQVVIGMVATILVFV